MGIGGIALAYIGSFVRWLFKGCKGTVNEIFLGKPEDDLSKSFTDSVLNKLIGFAFSILVIFTLGYLLQKGIL